MVEVFLLASEKGPVRRLPRTSNVRTGRLWGARRQARHAKVRGSEAACVGVCACVLPIYDTQIEDNVSAFILATGDIARGHAHLLHMGSEERSPAWVTTQDTHYCPPFLFFLYSVSALCLSDFLPFFQMSIQYPSSFSHAFFKCSRVKSNRI